MPERAVSPPEAVSEARHDGQHRRECRYSVHIHRHVAGSNNAACSGCAHREDARNPHANPNNDSMSATPQSFSLSYRFVTADQKVEGTGQLSPYDFFPFWSFQRFHYRLVEAGNIFSKISLTTPS